MKRMVQPFEQNEWGNDGLLSKWNRRNLSQTFLIDLSINEIFKSEIAVKPKFLNWELKFVAHLIDNQVPALIFIRCWNDKNAEMQILFHTNSHSNSPKGYHSKALQFTN